MSNGNLIFDEPQLVTDQEITIARKIGDERIKGLVDSDIRALRIKAKWDLAWLMYGPLGYTLLSPKLHGEVIHWVEETVYDQFSLFMLPRSHYKSTIGNSKIVQNSLPDDTGNAKYPYNLGPNLRSLIAHDVADMAQKFLRIITQHFTVNPLLIALFPECIPDPKKHKVNIRELQLPRSAYWQESTIDTMGVGARSQGNHYNILELDDIYGAEARDSKIEREAHIQWFDNIQSFLITPAKDFIRIRGTRWAFDDVYGHAIKTYGKSLKVFSKGVWETKEVKIGDKTKKINVKDNKGELIPIFPEQFTYDSLMILSKNKKVFDAQYLNDPSSGSTEFQPEWKRYFRLRGRELEITGITTPFGNIDPEFVNLGELDVVTFADPGMGETAGMVVCGTDSKNRRYLLEAYKGGMKPDAFRNRTFQLQMKWGGRLCLEYVLFSEVFAYWFQTEMAIKGHRFKIHGVRTGRDEKGLRVKALTQEFETGNIMFRDYMGVQSEQAEMMDLLIQEHDQFGATEDYHMLDALAMGPRLDSEGNKVWRRGGRIIQSSNSSNQSGRDVQTGYSKIRG